MKRLLFFLPLLVVLGLGGLFALRLTHPPEYSEEIRSVMVGKQAPALKLEPLPGVPLLEDAQLRSGKPVLVNFFASWCVPCRAEHPQLMALGKKYGVTVVGIAWKDSPENIAAFLKEMGNPFTHVGIDRSGRSGIDWGVAGVPESYIVGPDGRIALRHWGDIRPEHIEEKLLPALAKVQTP